MGGGATLMRFHVVKHVACEIALTEGLCRCVGMPFRNGVGLYYKPCENISSAGFYPVLGKVGLPNNPAQPFVSSLCTFVLNTKAFCSLSAP